MYHNFNINTVAEHIRSHKRKKLILDTDTFNEVDDQFAIGYAMLSDNIDVLAMTAAPFVSSTFTDPADGMEASFKELVKVRDMVDPDGKMNIPCYRGSRSFMENTITPVRSEAADNIIRIVHETDDIVYIAAIGAFTNVASALMIDPSIMVSHILGLNAYADAIYDMEHPSGLKKVCYTHLDLPMAAIEDFAELGKTDPLFAELDRIVKANGGLWCAEAEAYLLANAKRI